MCQKRLEWLDLKEKNRNRFIIRYKFKFKKMYAAETIKKIFRICHFSRNVDMNKHVTLLVTLNYVYNPFRLYLFQFLTKTDMQSN